MRRFVWLLMGLLLPTGCSSGASGGSEREASSSDSRGLPSPSASSVEVDGRGRCGAVPAGPESPPAGAVRVDADVVGDISTKTEANPPGTVFWLGPGTHRFI